MQSNRSRGEKGESGTHQNQSVFQPGVFSKWKTELRIIHHHCEQSPPVTVCCIYFK